jgi:hypothetical protein
LSGFVLVGTKWVIDKDPSALLDYTFDWTDWLVGDTIINKVITVVGGGTGGGACTEDHSTIVGGNKVVVWVAGGTAGAGKASVACRITTAGGRTDERTVYLRIKER